MAAIEAFDDDRALEVSLGSYDSFGAENTDLFAVKGESLRDINGINANLKRKIGREISKAYTGVGDAKAKATEVGYYSAYDAFGVVLPPYNLDYLAQVYELNAAHYAACNAKVSNIVGLGFSLITTPEVTDKINSAPSEERKDFMRSMDILKLVVPQLEQLDILDTSRLEQLGSVDLETATYRLLVQNLYFLETLGIHQLRIQLDWTPHQMKLYILKSIVHVILIMVYLILFQL